MELFVGDRIQLVRRFSNVNGWSLRKDFANKIATILAIEDRVNGAITVRMADGTTLLVFRDAIGRDTTNE